MIGAAQIAIEEEETSAVVTVSSSQLSNFTSNANCMQTKTTMLPVTTAVDLRDAAETTLLAAATKNRHSRSCDACC